MKYAVFTQCQQSVRNVHFLGTIPNAHELHLETENMKLLSEAAVHLEGCYESQNQERNKVRKAVNFFQPSHLLSKSRTFSLSFHQA